MANLAEIAAQLEKPFALEDIDFLPKGQFEKDGKAMVMGLPYADPRVYQDRLNAVCPGEWTSQASVTVAGNKIIALVTVTICGVAHTDVGEASLDGPTKENAGTESFAQGFKRACSQVGLGRYLYALDKAYLPYDKQRKKVALSPAELRNEVRKLYAKAGIIQQSNDEQAPAPTAQASEKSAQPASAQLTYQSVYKVGKDKGLWSAANGYYAFASHVLSSNVNAETVKTLAAPNLEKLLKAIEAEKPLAKTA